VLAELRKDGLLTDSTETGSSRRAALRGHLCS
jgi:hypothetical protein